jgi:DNA-binding NarL/FixJ family response regulator
VRGLMEAGVSAFLPKSIGREELVAAIRLADRERDNVLLSVSRKTVGDLDKPGGAPLTARELEVLELVAQALSNMQIATRLFIAEGTVRRHLTNIYTKLGAVSRVDAIRRATNRKLIAGMGE